MTPFEVDVLERVIERVEAMEQLKDPATLARLTMEGFEELMIRAGYSLADAHKAAMQRGWDRLSAGQML